MIFKKLSKSLQLFLGVRNDEKRLSLTLSDPEWPCLYTTYEATYGLKCLLRFHLVYFFINPHTQKKVEAILRWSGRLSHPNKGGSSFLFERQTKTLSFRELNQKIIQSVESSRWCIMVTMVTAERVLFLDLLSSAASGNVICVVSDGTHVLLSSAQLEVSPITPSSSPRVPNVPVVASVSAGGGMGLKNMGGGEG
eukprot:sb/3470931/